MTIELLVLVVLILLVICALVIHYSKAPTTRKRWNMMGWRTEDGALNEARNIRELSSDELGTVERFGIHDDDVEHDRGDGRIISGRMVCTKSGASWLVVALWEGPQGQSMARLCKPETPHTTTSKPMSALTLLDGTGGDLA